MGSYYVDAVLNGLKGKYPTKPRKNGKPKRFDAKEVAFLTTIAARQPNPGSYHGDLDPICYGDEKTLLDITHLSKSAFHETRNFLVELGYITFKTSEVHRCPTAKTGSKRFTNVYRINLKTLRQLYPDVEDWKTNVLKIAAGDRLSEDDLRALEAYSGDACTVRNTNLHVRNTESHVLNRDSIVRNTDTNTNITTKAQHQQTHTPAGGVAVDDVFLMRVIHTIAQRVNVLESSISKNPVAAAIAGKNPDSVLNTINGFSCTKNIQNPTGALISQLKNLPLKEDDKPSPAKTAQSTDDFISKIASPVFQDLTKTALKNTGFNDIGFLENLQVALSNAQKTDEGKFNGFATEVIDAAKRNGKTPMDKASFIINELRLPQDKWDEYL